MEKPMEREILVNKVKTILLKLIFPIEFIVSLCMTYSVFRFVVLKNYVGITSVKHIIYIAIAGILLLLLMIYNYGKNKEKIEKIVISFLIPIGMLYTIFMLPSQIPDELGHLWRTYEISEGKFISSKEATTVPADLVYHVKSYVNNYQEFNTVLSDTTDYHDKVEVNNTFKTYPFFLYIFGAIGFLIARILHLNILLGCYLACLMNFIVLLLTVYYAIKIIPFGKWTITSIVFMPMFLHQATSTSADSIMNILSLLFISFVVALLFKEEKMTKKEEVGFFVLSVLLALSKYVYLPIIFLGILLVFSKNVDKKRTMVMLSITFGISILLVIAYFVFSGIYESPHKEYLEQNHVNMSGQVKEVVSHPIKFMGTIGNTLYLKGEEWIGMMIGTHLGWLEIHVPSLTIITYIIVILASCFIEKNKVAFSLGQKVFAMLISIGTILLVITGLYLHWTGVGANVVEGVQGRYFIPVAFLLVLILSRKENYIKVKNIQLILPIILCLLNLSALNSIYEFFK